MPPEITIDRIIEVAIWAIHDVGLPTSIPLVKRMQIRTIMRDAVISALEAEKAKSS